MSIEGSTELITSEKDKFLKLFPISPYKSNSEWGKELGQSPNTISNWKTQNREMLEAARKEFVEGLKDQMIEGCELAIQSIVDILKTTKSERNKLQASQTLLSYSFPKTAQGLTIDGSNSQITITISDKKAEDIKPEPKVIEGEVIVVKDK